MNVELRHLRYVIAVADELHFSRAAKRLYMGQPALSARIRELERELGVPLFDRTTRSVRITPAGEAFVEQARRALASVELAVRNAQDAGRGITGRLRLGFFGAAMLELTGPLLDTINEIAPKVEVELRQRGWDDSSAGLSTGDVDCAIVRPPFEARGLRVVPLLSEPRVLALHHRHPLAGRRRLSLSEVLDEPITARRTPDTRWRDFWLGTEYRNGHPPTAVVEIANLDEEMQAVATGRAVSLTAAGAARFYRRPGVRFVMLDDVAPSVIALAHPLPATELAAIVERAALAVLVEHPNLAEAIARATDGSGWLRSRVFEETPDVERRSPRVAIADRQ